MRACTDLELKRCITERPEGCRLGMDAGYSVSGELADLLMLTLREANSCSNFAFSARKGGYCENYLSSKAKFLIVVGLHHLDGHRGDRSKRS